MKYSYTIDVQNNYTGSTQNVVVVDKLADGIQFLGMNCREHVVHSSGGFADPRQFRRHYAHVEPRKRWSASGTQRIVYDTGIRYDYFGTDNGGNNRPNASSLTSATAGALIPDKKSLLNDVRSDATWHE